MNGDAEHGVYKKRPHLNAGQGVNRQRPHHRDTGQLPENVPGAHIPTSATQPLINYFTELAERLRGVRVCCGDWARVVTTGALSYGRNYGIFLDPPYDGEVRTKNLYSTDDHDVSAAVREWAVANGDNPKYRIVLAGYDDEHASLMPTSWRVHRYSASLAYGSANGGGVNAANRHKECLWFSPHCVLPEQNMLDFGNFTV
jgi:hypothetical protein